MPNVEYYCRGANESEWKEIGIVFHKAFNSSTEEYGMATNWAKTKQPPLKNIRLIIEKNLDTNAEKIVGSSPILNFSIHFGDTTFKAGGLCDVATLPEYQGKGLGLKLQHDVAEYLTKNDYDIGFLFTGSYPFYAKAGWVQSFMKYTSRLPVSKGKVSSKETPKLSFKPLEKEDIPTISSIYEEFNKSYYLTKVRDLNWWNYTFSRKLFRSPHLKVFSIFKEEKIIGHMILSIEKENKITLTKLHEYSMSKSGFEDEIINKAQEFSQNNNSDFIEIRFPDTYPLAKVAFANGAQDNSAMLSGRMVRIQDFDKILPTIHKYLVNYRIPLIMADAEISLPKLKIALEFDSNSKFGLSIDATGDVPKIDIYEKSSANPANGGYEILKVPHFAMISMVFGNFLPTDLEDDMEDEWIIENEDHLNLLDVIFAPMKGILYDIDHF
jgi:predicted acetyltransferase